MNKKKVSIKVAMIKRLAVITIAINFVVLGIIGVIARAMIQDVEGRYLAEISANISNSIDKTMEEFLTITTVLAQTDSVINLLIESDKDNLMHNNPNASVLVKEMDKMASHYLGEILFMGVFDIEQDGYLMNDGSYSDDAFSFKEWDYYEPVVTKKSMITEPYFDTEIDEIVVSICSPVFSDSGEILGITLVDLSTSFVSELIINSSFGDTGSSFILDSQNGILAHETESLIASNLTALKIDGSNFQSELSNPSGELFEYVEDGVNKIGVLGTIGSYGWKIVTSFDLEEFNYSTVNLLVILFCLLSTSTAFTLIVVALTVSSSLKPLAYIKNAMHELAKGHTNYEFDYVSNNEIGDLADDLRFTMKNLSMYINEIKFILENCSKGDFTIKSEIEFIGDFKGIKISIEQFTILISKTLDSLKATVEQVTIGSASVAQGSQNLAEGSIRQSESVQELTTTIADITENINKNAENAKDVNEAVIAATGELGVSNDKMNAMINSMTEITETSQGIEKIVKTIEDVAFQTNILALNAAVEAARAGQSGKGFAVVADEVRTLASRTSAAVKETSSLIYNTSKAVSNGNKLADDTSSSLKSVTQDINEFIVNLEKITQASTEQATAISQINQGVTDISIVLQTNSAISEESAATSEELSSQASVMRDAINQFKTLR